MQHWTIGLEVFVSPSINQKTRWVINGGYEPELAWTLNGSTPQNPNNRERFLPDCFVNGEVLLDDMSFEVASKGLEAACGQRPNLRLTASAESVFASGERFADQTRFRYESWYGQVLE